MKERNVLVGIEKVVRVSVIGGDDEALLGDGKGGRGVPLECLAACREMHDCSFNCLAAIKAHAIAKSDPLAVVVGYLRRFPDSVAPLVAAKKEDRARHDIEEEMSDHHICRIANAPIADKDNFKGIYHEK